MKCELFYIDIFKIVSVKVEYIYNTIHIYSGITSGRVLSGELLYTESCRVGRNLYETVCRQMQTN